MLPHFSLMIRFPGQHQHRLAEQPAGVPQPNVHTSQNHHILLLPQDSIHSISSLMIERGIAWQGIILTRLDCHETELRGNSQTAAYFDILTVWNTFGSCRFPRQLQIFPVTLWGSLSATVTKRSLTGRYIHRFHLVYDRCVSRLLVFRSYRNL